MNYFNDNDFELIENTEEIEKEENIGFVIDSPSKADWAIKKIKDAQERLDLFMIVLEEQKNELKKKENIAKEKYRQETEYLLTLLSEYMENLPCKETKTQKTFEFPSGKIIKKFPKFDFEYDENELLQEYANTDFVENKPKLKWGELKKTLSIIDGKVVEKETGEIIDYVTIKEIPEKIEIK